MEHSHVRKMGAAYHVSVEQEPLIWKTKYCNLVTEARLEYVLVVLQLLRVKKLIWYSEGNKLKNRNRSD